MQRPPVSDTSLLDRKMPADSMTEHEYDVVLIFLFRDAVELPDAVSRSEISICILSEICAASKWCLFSFLKRWESKEIANGMMRRTGLWIFEEGLKVLEANKASEKVQAICFERDGTDEIVDQGC
ncbi:uncharacterized protein LOC115749655 isoform X2 [Rhodamnia argentea]|uniref:Uncharacterized protein LOC115749655 isoform X2 n=1 Tax=Rhodamnia argentea TaxID=178133 RepID=A0ABM3HAR7_9MYRT|nr:uncharacterized protein LOC115749655 isoform X2 [Rhodamnia argentea]